eukprot:1152402-Pelagomonas_calceolata.AAC.16
MGVHMRAAPSADSQGAAGPPLLSFAACCLYSAVLKAGHPLPMPPRVPWTWRVSSCVAEEAAPLTWRRLLPPTREGASG